MNNTPFGEMSLAGIETGSGRVLRINLDIGWLKY